LRARLLLALLSLYLGIELFFSFLVAPTLFSLLGTKLAGKVVARLFPFYFSLGTFTSLTAFLLSRGFSLPVRAGSFILFSLFAFETFYVEPTMSRLKLEDYSLFLKYHGFSMALNLVIILITLVLVGLLVWKGEGNER